MKKDYKKLIISVLVCLSPMILGAILYGRLPEQMPIHFTINDIPDNYAPKNFALFGIPLIMAVVQAICLLAVNTKANKIENSKKPKILKIMEWFIPILTVLVYIIMIEVPLGSTVYVGKSVCLILGILFMIIGNYMPKVSYENGKNIFHPTPKNEASFRKTTRIMGYSFIGLGIIFLMLIIFV